MALDPELAAIVPMLPNMEELDLAARRAAIDEMVAAASQRDAERRGAPHDRGPHGSRAGRWSGRARAGVPAQGGRRTAPGVPLVPRGRVHGRLDRDGARLLRRHRRRRASASRSRSSTGWRRSTRIPQGSRTATRPRGGPLGAASSRSIRRGSSSRAPAPVVRSPPRSRSWRATGAARRSRSRCSTSPCSTIG